MARVHPLTGEGGAGDDEGPLWNDPFQSAGQQQPESQSAKASEEPARLLLASLLPGGRFGFHQAVEAVQVIVRGQLLLRAGTQSFGFQRAPEDTCKKRVPS